MQGFATVCPWVCARLQTHVRKESHNHTHAPASAQHDPRWVAPKRVCGRAHVCRQLEQALIVMLCNLLLLLCTCAPLQPCYVFSVQWLLLLLLLLLWLWLLGLLAVLLTLL